MITTRIIYVAADGGKDSVSFGGLAPAIRKTNNEELTTKRNP